MNDSYFGLRRPHDNGRRRLQHRRSFFCFQEAQGAQELRDQKVECRRSLGLGNHIMDLDLYNSEWEFQNYGHCCGIA
ncbi:unnamed protein product [Rhodiola kirilowii]